MGGPEGTMTSPQTVTFSIAKAVLRYFLHENNSKWNHMAPQSSALDPPLGLDEVSVE